MVSTLLLSLEVRELENSFATNYFTSFSKLKQFGAEGFHGYHGCPVVYVKRFKAVRWLRAILVQTNFSLCGRKKFASIMSYRWVLCTVYCVQCFVYSVLCTVFYVQCFVYSVLCTVYCVQWFTYSDFCTLFYVQCFMYSVLCTVFYVQCFVYSVFCTMFSKGLSGSVHTSLWKKKTQNKWVL